MTGLAVTARAGGRRNAGPATTEAGAATRDAILAAAATLFNRQDFHGTSIRDLADAAGIASATLYHHFKTKPDILFGVISRFLADFNAELLAVVGDRTRPPAERLCAAIHSHLRLTTERAEELLDRSPQLQALNPQQRGQIQRYRRTYRAAFKEMIQQGIDEGAFHTEQPSLTTTALLDMLDGVRLWFRPGRGQPADAIADHYCQLALAMLRAERPR